MDEVEQTIALQERCKTDLKFLVTEVMKLHRWNDNLHNGIVNLLESEGDRKLVLLPRGHQKSTIISVAWVVQQILRDPDVRIQIISATWKLSKDLLHQIKRILEDSDLKELFGQFATKKTRWTTEFIDVAQCQRRTKDPTISTGGIGTGKTGSHCDIMILDDVVSPENTTTPELIRKTIGGYQDLLPLIDPGGKLVVVGTRYAISDLYGHILANEARSINGQLLETDEDKANWRKFIK